MLLRSTTKDTFDLLASLIPHIENILNNDKVVDLFMDQFDLKTTDENFKPQAYKFLMKKVLSVLPVILVDNREDIFMILAKVNDTCIVEIENQDPLVTLNQVKELIGSKELMGFVEQLRY